MAFTIPKSAQVARNAAGAVEHIDHVREPYRSPSRQALTSQALAVEYLADLAELYQIPRALIEGAGEQVAWGLSDAPQRLSVGHEKRLDDTTVVSFAQSVLGLPIWEAGFSVVTKGDPPRVTSSHSTVHAEVDIEPPGEEARFTPEHIDKAKLRRILSVKAKGTELHGTRLRVYRYQPELRHHPETVADQQEKAPEGRSMGPPTLDLPPVDDRIRPGRHYVVTEILFAAIAPGEDRPINWRAFVEVESGAVLYLRSFVAHVDGMVFKTDPNDQSGGTTVDAADAASVLDPYRSSETLPGLAAPASGADQELSGNFVEVQEIESPTHAPPTEASGTDFDYGSRTQDFAAVNAYYHTDRMFRMVQDMGFNMGTYFDNTTFPVPVDHWAKNGAVNASCEGNAAGNGVGRFLYGRCVSGQPVGISTEARTVMHEFGHAILWDSVESPNFGFAHSAGDSLATVLNDAESNLTGSDRFLVFTWCPITGAGARRCDRTVAAGWGWGGTRDTGGYPSEEILTSTLFRAYQAMGGDSAQRNMKRYAARYMAYLIFRACGSLATSPITPTNTPDVFSTALQTADLTDFGSEAGGAYGKVIRWAFEKQGLYSGDPPDVDVYIDDGRGGEYTHLPNFWNTTDIWNRTSPDGGTTHERPVLSTTNYVYVRVNNRGTQRADNVRVRGYHCRPGTGLVWPADWQSMTTAELSAGSINSGADTVVGPFHWTPTVADHECLLMIARADGDPSNVDATGGTITSNIPHWRLVPHDNNIAQRNVSPHSGGSRSDLVESFARAGFFWFNNPFIREVRGELVLSLPGWLEKKGWRLSANTGDLAIQLPPRGSQEVRLQLHPGDSISAADIRPGDAIEVTALVDGLVVGGMTYPIDPSVKTAPTERPEGDFDDLEKLLECLDERGHRVKRIRPKRVIVAIDLDDDC